MTKPQSRAANQSPCRIEALKRCDQMVVIIRQEGPEDEWISQGMQAEITAAAKMGIEPQFIYIGKEKR